jgi:hypothetical protein
MLYRSHAAGNCTSTSDRQATAHSNPIDNEIEDDGKKFRKEGKILLSSVFVVMVGIASQVYLCAYTYISYYLGMHTLTSSLPCAGSDKSGKSKIAK